MAPNVARADDNGEVTTPGLRDAACDMTADTRRRPGRGGAQRSALRNGFLVRYAVTVLGNLLAESMIFLGTLVYAFEQGGARATGLASIALLVPYVVFAPLAGAMAERHPPQRVRIGTMIVQTVGWSVAALAAHADQPAPLVVAAAMVGIAASTALGPAGAVLRPAIVRSSRELTVANLWNGYADSVSVLAAPLIGAGLLVVGGAPAVIGASAAASLLALALALVRRPIDPPGGSELTDREGAFRLMGRELRDVRRRPGVLGVMAVTGGQYFAVGALDVIIVVAAVDDLELGPSGPGLLVAAFGLGTFVSGAATTVLVRRRRLAPVIAVAMVTAAAAALCLGATLSVIAAFVLLPVLGLSRSVQGFLGRILLQRSADPQGLASVYAVLGLAGGLGMILGSLVAQALIAVSGTRAALLGTGVFFLLLLAATIRSLRTADDSADVPVVAMSLLRRVSIFAPLPRTELEAVSRSAFEVSVDRGSDVIVQGEAGDRFYAVADGSFDVVVDGSIVDTVGRGGSFGELALLADSPRAATITATSAGSLLAIERQPFLVAVTGHDSSRQAAWGVMQRLHGDATAIDGPHQFVDPHGDAPETTPTGR